MIVGIIGTGWIADKMAETLTGLNPTAKRAVASRDAAKAQAFAQRWGFEKAYGSYEQLVEDPEVDLVYIATPHSHHYQHAKLAIEAGKPVLCEKAFTANARQADRLLNLAHQRGVFITEAIWTRYMPLSLKVKELLDAGTIGEPRLLNCSLCYEMSDKERIWTPELCGGSLLDLSVYCINFARMYFGGDIASQTSSCVKGKGGMDAHDMISWAYNDGRIANLQSSAVCQCSRAGMIAGTKGFIVVENTNCPDRVTVYDSDYKPVQIYQPAADRITGYEYQVLACEDALSRGLLESPYMPHAETLAIMEIMDGLRRDWGIRYPADEAE